MKELLAQPFFKLTVIKKYLYFQFEKEASILFINVTRLRSESMTTKESHQSRKDKNEFFEKFSYHFLTKDWIISDNFYAEWKMTL